MGWLADRKEKRRREQVEAEIRDAETRATMLDLVRLSHQMQSQVTRLEAVTDRLNKPS